MVSPPPRAREPRIEAESRVHAAILAGEGPSVSRLGGRGCDRARLRVGVPAPPPWAILTATACATWDAWGGDRDLNHSPCCVLDTTPASPIPSPQSSGGAGR